MRRIGDGAHGVAIEPVEDVIRLFAQYGAGHYGEAVTQERHALQCAQAAGDDGADDALVVAALLHDVGHLLSGAERSDRSSVDDAHETAGARWLAPRFGPAVAQPVALHVLAKRYRCTVDPGMVADLSPGSRHSLQLQGGTLDPVAAARFAAHPGAPAALALRTWDEAAKDPSATTPDLAAFIPYLRRMAEPHDRHLG